LKKDEFHMHPDPTLRTGPKIRMTGTKILVGGGGDGVKASTSVSTVGFWKDGK